VKKVQEIKGTHYAFEDLPKRFQDPVLGTRDGQVNAYKAYLIDLYINDIHSNGSFIRIPRKCKTDKNGNSYPSTIPGYIKLERTGMGIVTGFTKGVVKAVPSVLAVMAIAVLGGSSNSVSSVGASLLASTAIADMATQGSSSNVHSNNARQLVKEQYSGRGTNALGFQNIVFVPISEEAWKEEEDFRKGCAYILNIPKGDITEYVDTVFTTLQDTTLKRLEDYIKFIRNLKVTFPGKYDGLIDRLIVIAPDVFTSRFQSKDTPNGIQDFQGGSKKSKKTRKNKKSRRHH
jgi:hypothetical protein